jgi:hypothetical protein
MHTETCCVVLTSFTRVVPFTPDPDQGTAHRAISGAAEPFEKYAPHRCRLSAILLPAALALCVLLTKRHFLNYSLAFSRDDRASLPQIGLRPHVIWRRGYVG